MDKFEKRLERLEDFVLNSGFDGVILNPGATLTYLTGLSFHLMERPVLFIFIPKKEPVMVLPKLEEVKLEALTYAINPVFYGDNPEDKNVAFRKAVEMIKLDKGRFLIEPTRLRFLEMKFLQDSSPGWQLESGDAILEQIRIQKDETEIAAMQMAVNIAQNSFLELLPGIRIGRSELECASELTSLLLKNGSDPELPFQVIFSVGPNSANPHAVPGDRKITHGDLIVVDWGASYLGYAADLTRTLVVGKPEEWQSEIADTVLKANAAGRTSGKPGIPAGDVDRAARMEVSSAGYGEYFTHRTGHGLGMEAHESPYIYGENQEILKPGMTYTIEPGIYLPGRGGVRIEDDVVVTEQGSRSLSDLPRELYVIA
jgi:Xaa-Pro dipeptidase